MSGPQGYGKLWGKLLSPNVASDMSGAPTLGSDAGAQSIDLVVDTLPVTLGRAENMPANGNSVPKHININIGDATNNTISRKHVEIFCDEPSGEIKLKCLSKNGVDADKVHYDKEAIVTLVPKMAIRTGNAYMYWLPAVKPSGGGGGGYLKVLVEAATEDASLHAALSDPNVGVKSALFRDWIRQHRSAAYADTKDATLTQGIYAALKSTSKMNPFVRQGSGADVRYIYATALPKSTSAH